MRDAIAAEWLKFRSLRSNLYLLAAALLAPALCAGLAFMVTRGFDNQSGADRLAFDSLGAGLGTGLPVAYVVFGTLGALSITAEHATGLIRTSLAAVPRRQAFLLSKVPVLLAVGLVTGMVLAFAMHLATAAVLGDRAGVVLLSGDTLGPSLGDEGVLATVVLAGVSMPLVALVGLGLGTVIRSTAGTLVALVILLFVLPVAAMTMPNPWRARIGAFMIESLPAQIAGGGLLAPPTATALLLLYPVVALSLGAVAIALRGRRLRALAAGLVATALVAGAGTAPVAAAVPAASAIEWRPCAGVKDLECATIEVPVDWANPRGRKIALPLGRLPATGTQRRIGTVFSIPGGPGGPGLDDLKQRAGSFAKLREHFDVVSLNPRNTPALDLLDRECLKTGPWIARPENGAEWAALAKTNRVAAQKCRARDPELFDHADSASFARDIDAIRAALGERKLSFVATSYGGVPAVAYARLFPARIRALYLDGVGNHLLGKETEERMRYATLDAQFARFAAWCEADSACALHGRDVGAAWRALVAAADRVPVPVKGEQAAYSGFDLKIAALPHLVSPGAENLRWKELAKAVERAEGGDATGFADYVEAGAGSLKPPSPVGMNMTHCLDGLGYGGYAEYRAHRALGSPELVGSEQWHPLGCAGWPVPVRNPVQPIPVQALPPMLGAGTWTDYAATADLAMRVPGSSTVRFDGNGHGLYLSGDACTIAHANRYLVSLRLPPPGTVCRPE